MVMCRFFCFSLVWSITGGISETCKNGLLVFFVESCGVHYTYANRHVVDPSKAEYHLSKQALRDVFELQLFSKQPVNCLPTLEVRQITPQNSKFNDSKKIEN